MDGSAWTTDKDGIILALLASEILAVTGKTPSQLYVELTEQFGSPVYERVDAPATKTQKAALGKLTGEAITATELAGETIIARLSEAPGNSAAVGGVKVVTENALVRGPSERHRRRLQDLRRVVPRRRAPSQGPGRGEGHRRRRSRRLVDGCPRRASAPRASAAPCRRPQSPGVVGRGGQSEELLERGDAEFVHPHRQFRADEPEVPRLEDVPGDGGFVARVAQDEAEPPRV